MLNFPGKNKTNTKKKTKKNKLIIDIHTIRVKQDKKEPRCYFKSIIYKPRTPLAKLKSLFLLF